MKRSITDLLIEREQLTAVAALLEAQLQPHAARAPMPDTSGMQGPAKSLAVRCLRRLRHASAYELRERTADLALAVGQLDRWIARAQDEGSL